jgi:transposase InsO family protein
MGPSKSKKIIKKNVKQGTLSSKEKGYLKRLYLTLGDAAGFTTPTTLLREVRSRGKYSFTLRQIRDYLSEYEAYTLTRQRREKFRKVPFISHYTYEIVQIDLVDMIKYSKDNDNFKYWLTAVDSFSRKAHIQILKDKKGATVASAFKRIVSEIPGKIYSTYSDLGSEFRSSDFRKMLDSLNIRHIFSPTAHAPIVERFHRSLKMRLNRYFIHKRTFSYIHILDHLLKSYNNSHHSSINMRPNDVSLSNQFTVYKYMKSKNEPPPIAPYKFNLGQSVRISFEKKPFDREMGERYSREIFQILKRYRRHNINLYKLIDCSKEYIIGTWYENELQAVTSNTSDLFEIESVLRKRGDVSLVK